MGNYKRNHCRVLQPAIINNKYKMFLIIKKNVLLHHQLIIMVWMGCAILGCDDWCICMCVVDDIWLVGWPIDSLSLCSRLDRFEYRYGKRLAGSSFFISNIRGSSPNAKKKKQFFLSLVTNRQTSRACELKRFARWYTTKEYLQTIFIFYFY